MNSHSKRYISYANGYRELGMFEDALNELQKIDSLDCNHPSARLVRLSIYEDQCNWALVTSEAESLVTEFPQEVEYWIQWAYGSRRAHSIAAARSILQRAHQLFPLEPCILYNLGCYACVEEDLNDALKKVNQAIALDKTFSKLAMKDEDLESIKEWLDKDISPET